ncbi:MAG: TolC family protein, partial [Bacteroidota bacterium]
MKLFTFKMFASIFRFFSFALVMLLLQSTTTAQNILSSANKTITQKQFFELILKYHPVAKQSSLLTERGKKIIQQSKGAFDPQFYTYFDEKYFSSKNYYSLWEGGLKVSTRVGIDIKAGYQTSNGLYLNPEEITPTNGLSYIGASIPLAQGLLIDSRRAALQQAKIFSKSLEAERILMLNDLLFDAAKSYWQWVESYGQLIVYQKSLDVAQIRFDAVKSNLQNGESPSIDTVEALIQLQSLELNYQKSFLEFKNSGLIVSNYLWYENDQPMAMDSLLRPSIIDSLPSIQLEIPVSTIKKNLAEIIKNHPSVLEYTYKVKSAQVDKNFYTNKLLPKI